MDVTLGPGSGGRQRISLLFTSVNAQTHVNTCTHAHTDALHPGIPPGMGPSRGPGAFPVARSVPAGPCHVAFSIWRKKITALS